MRGMGKLTIGFGTILIALGGADCALAWTPTVLGLLWVMVGLSAIGDGAMCMLTPSQDSSDRETAWSGISISRGLAITLLVVSTSCLFYGGLGQLPVTRIILAVLVPVVCLIHAVLTTAWIRRTQKRLVHQGTTPWECQLQHRVSAPNLPTGAKRARTGDGPQA